MTIPAGGTAHALFAYGNAEVSTSGCKPKTAMELRVYPPNSKTAINAFFDLPACSLGGKHVYLTSIPPRGFATQQARHL